MLFFLKFASGTKPCKLLPKMQKKNIALVAGGDSGEYVISVESARMISRHLDPGLYNVYTLLINRHKWVYVDASGRELPVDKNDFSILLDGKTLKFDCAFITIHGSPGEDGKLQAYFDLLGISYTTAGLLPSAMTFNKYYCKLLVSSFGFPVARSLRLHRGDSEATARIPAGLGLPVFVKPNSGGSSLGTTFVKNREMLPAALEQAFLHDSQVLVEEYLEGTELSCGVFRYEGRVRALPVTEIVSKTKAAFFDFEAKYTPGGADEITPARIPPALTAKVRQVSARLYALLELRGLVRFDFIFSKDLLYFLEVNLTPGMSPTSIVPQQAAVEGISCRELFTMMIAEAMSGR